VGNVCIGIFTVKYLDK